MEYTGPKPTGEYLLLLLYDLLADQEGIRITGEIEASGGQIISFDTGNRKEIQELMRKWRTSPLSCDA
jgi:hypothetical protein